MGAVAMSIWDFGQFNSPEVIIGLSSVVSLLVVLILGFFYKRHQSRK